MEIPRVAVVATHNRPAELARLLDAITPQCTAVVVVDNASDPPVKLPDTYGDSRHMVRVHVLRDEEQPPNLSRLWNLGIDYARALVNPYAGEPWDLAVLNDDAVPPPGWWDAVSGAMRRHSASAACADAFDRLGPGSEIVYFADAPMSVVTRLAGWAFILPGEQRMRLDERFRWLCGDDDISYRARLANGLVQVGGYPVPNTGADSSTRGVLAEQGARDMQTFVNVHGRRPW